MCVCLWREDRQKVWKKYQNLRLHWVFITVAKQQYFTWNLVFFIYSPEAQVVLINCKKMFLLLVSASPRKKNNDSIFYYYYYFQAWAINVSVMPSHDSHPHSHLLLEGPPQTAPSFFQGGQISQLMKEVDQCKIKERTERTKRGFANVPEMFAEQWWVHTLTFHFMLYWLGLSFIFFSLSFSFPTGLSRVATWPGVVVALAISPNSAPSSQQCHRKCRLWGPSSLTNGAAAKTNVSLLMLCIISIHQCWELFKGQRLHM